LKQKKQSLGRKSLTFIEAEKNSQWGVLLPLPSLALPLHFLCRQLSQSEKKSKPGRLGCFSATQYLPTAKDTALWSGIRRIVHMNIGTIRFGIQDRSSQKPFVDRLHKHKRYKLREILVLG
jgi:hypothetical protein